jgi:hypothetical protein
MRAASYPDNECFPNNKSAPPNMFECILIIIYNHKYIYFKIIFIDWKCCLLVNKKN